MKPRNEFELPSEKRGPMRRAIRLEWWSLFWLGTIITLMGLTMGQSQAMKAAWLEDVLSMVPPIAILVASRFRDRRPTRHYPYGFHRATSIAFLCAAIALFAMGTFLVWDSVSKLIRREHPTIGLVEIFGRDLWLGWLMIAALSYSAIAPVILGRMKLPLARALHDKALHADADMNKADWLTALAGILGVLGIAMGWWWADSVAAAFISVEVLRDGVKNVRRVISDLMDSTPTTVPAGEEDEVVERLETWFRGCEWVADASARLREEGHVFSGEVFVVPRPGIATERMLGEMADATERIHELDWRLWDVVIMPVASLGGREEEGRKG